MAAMSLIGAYFSRKMESRMISFWRQGNALDTGRRQLSLFFDDQLHGCSGRNDQIWFGLFVAYLIVPLVIPVINRIVLPILMKLLISSAYDYLDKRFGNSNETSEYVFVAKTLLWMGAIIYTASLVNAVTG